ncbi:MAG: TatD DNase family protein [Hydrocarboniphaga sp.]|uniref:TatD family hydrolase n=1 Tax=Hydrocarboniphaga sp. TaxID=2033016 RepID=UPI00262BF110|nr:TatD family hydrolase [Hydrocarboniphaga sp.]MDB5969412.1 TatD DNase family protein [Hydrocarboniphaga sp.]
MKLIDIGANLAHESFGQDLPAVLARAQHAGVGAIVVTGSSAESSQAAATLAAAHPGFLYATAGLHPHHASDWNEALAEALRRLASQPGVLAMGECGLDYFRDLSPREAQRRAFTAQLDLAVELKLPVFLHQRDAHPDFFAILRDYRSQLADAVVHCFTDTTEALADYLRLDCHIGITGWICDERRGRHLLAAVRGIPADRLLIETDAPYLLPRTAPKAAHRRNEPGYLIYVLRTIAAARGVDEDELANITTDNAMRFFRIAIRA